MVAAIAHDLRTPITALRLRLEFLPDDDNTRSMARTLEDMAGMSEAALTFMREETAAEATRNVDLSALVDALCEDYRASGAAVVFEPEARVALVCRPVEIRRALRNIIDNALAYGERATSRSATAPSRSCSRSPIPARASTTPTCSGCLTRSCGWRPRAAAKPAAPAWDCRSRARWFRGTAARSGWSTPRAAG